MMLAHLPNNDINRVDISADFLHLAETGNLPSNAPISPGHKDGWGTAYYRTGSLVGHYRAQHSATNDELKTTVINQINDEVADVILMHVRKVTVGEPSERNSHPFLSGKFSFVHNGTLGATDQSVFDPVRGRVSGETDSEYYFHLVIRELNANEEHDKNVVSDQIIRTVKALRTSTSYQGGSFTSASSMLTDGRFAYVIREYDEHHPFVCRYNAHDYYTLFHGVSMSGAQIFCSETLSMQGVTWNKLPNHSLTVLDLVTGKKDILSI